MDKNIEIELRGPLSKKQYIELISSFTKKGIFKKNKERILIDYTVYLQGQSIKGRNKDIRLRVTNGVPEIVIKLGNWGGSDNRKELSILAKKGEFDKLVQIFAALGFTKGMLCIRNSQVFEYKKVEFALVEVPNHSYYFEAEILINEGKNKNEAKNYIQKIIEELDLKTFSDEDFYQYIEDLNKEANVVFDFQFYKENYFKNRFKL